MRDTSRIYASNSMQTGGGVGEREISCDRACPSAPDRPGKTRSKKIWEVSLYFQPSCGRRSPQRLFYQIFPSRSIIKDSPAVRGVSPGAGGGGGKVRSTPVCSSGRSGDGCRKWRRRNGFPPGQETGRTALPFHPFHGRTGLPPRRRRPVGTARECPSSPPSSILPNRRLSRRRQNGCGSTFRTAGRGHSSFSDQAVFRS